MFGRKVSFIKVIGKGGFGTVYLAEVEDNNRFRQRIAIKLLHDKYQEISQAVARHQDEARLLGLLNHDNIVKVYDLGKLNGQPAVFMEYVEGVTLSQLLKQQPLPAKIVFEIGADCASALNSAFSSVHPKTNQPLCVIHRDIKPSNILLSKSGVVKILDFGIARANFDRESRTQTNQLGTTRYMAPEQWLEQSSSNKVDIYALGFSMLEMLTGRLLQRMPLDAEYHLRTLDQHLSTIPKVPSEGRDVLRQMLSFEAQNRPEASVVSDFCLSLSEQLSGTNLHLYAREFVPSLLQEQEDSVTHIPLPDTSMVVQTYATRKTNLFWPLLALGLALFTLLPSLLPIRSSPSPSVMTVLESSPPPSAPTPATPISIEPPSPDTPPQPAKTKRTRSRASKTMVEAPPPVLHPVSFSSIPLGAEVFIDGTKIGTTLVSQMKLAQGKHQVEMVWGEQRMKKTIQLDSDQPHRFVWTIKDNQWSSYLD